MRSIRETSGPVETSTIRRLTRPPTQLEVSSTAKRRPSDSVANCLFGGNDSKQDHERSSARGKRSEVDTNRIFGPPARDSQNINNTPVQNNLTNYDKVLYKDSNVADEEVDDYLKQRTKEEVK